MMWAKKKRGKKGKKEERGREGLSPRIDYLTMKTPLTKLLFIGFFVYYCLLWFLERL